MSAPIPIIDLSPQGDPGVPVRVVLQWPPGEDVLVLQLQAWVIMRRQGGVLFAVPDMVLDADSLSAHSQFLEDGSDPLVGPYMSYVVPLLTMSEDGALVSAEEQAKVMVIDMSHPAINALVKAYPEDGAEEMDLLHVFGTGDPAARPDFSVLLPQVKEWVSNEVFERTAYYSAQEEEQPETSAETRPKAKASAPGSTMPGKAASTAKAAPKKHTVATLAQQVELLMGSLPAITDQLAKLAAQQETIIGNQPGSAGEPPFKALATSKAAMPVSSLLNQGPRASLSGLAKMVGPPPPVRAAPPAAAPVDPGQLLEEDEPMDPLQASEEDKIGSPMAQALLQQSKVLTALMSHLQVTNSDPLSDLSSTTPTTGIKGTVAREKLQRELSMGNGQFFLRVCQQIQKRMSPTSRPAANLSEASDVSLLAYLERYGGYGQCRELGMIMWSIGHAFDALAGGEVGLAQDHLAMTAVMVEQASLDSNKWQLAWLVRLLDDPPQNLWINRGQTATGTRRSFAPLSTPSWNTVALAFLKESEVLQGKRSELLGAKGSAVEDSPAPKPSPKRRPGRGKGAQNQGQSEEAKGSG